MEKTISFINSNGYRLFGILHVPDKPCLPSTGVICLNTGLQYRVIWHRLNIKMARTLCALGYYVLRFDTHGIGDSEGDIEIDSINTEDFHDAIQVGLFVPDTLSAIDFFFKEVRLENLYLIGPCGGALTAMITASKSKKVSGLIYMAGPVTITSSELTIEMHPRNAQKAIKIRIRKIWNPTALFRLFTGRSEISVITKALKVSIQSLLNRRSLVVQDDADKAEKGGLFFNRVFLDSFNEFVSRGGEILFLMPESDRSSWGFRELFEKKFLVPGNPYEKRYTILYVPKANHIYALEESQKYVLDQIVVWLRR